MAGTGGRIGTCAIAAATLHAIVRGVTDADIARRRARLAELEAELARLRGQHDMAMNKFKFDEARALGSRIEAIEGERNALAGAIPPFSGPPPVPYSVAHRRRR
jgi:hypothetical protein